MNTNLQLEPELNSPGLPNEISLSLFLELITPVQAQEIVMDALNQGLISVEDNKYILN